MWRISLPLERERRRNGKEATLCQRSLTGRGFFQAGTTKVSRNRRCVQRSVRTFFKLNFCERRRRLESCGLRRTGRCQGKERRRRSRIISTYIRLCHYYFHLRLSNMAVASVWKRVRVFVVFRGGAGSNGVHSISQKPLSHRVQWNAIYVEA